MRIVYEEQLSRKDVIGQKIVDFDLFIDEDGDEELDIMLENGKQIEIVYNHVENYIDVQSD